MIDLRKYILYLPSQDNIDCCTSCAALLATEIMLATQGIYMNFSRLFLYYMTRKMQGRLGQKGAELETTLKSLILNGVCLEKTWPFMRNLVDKEPSINAIYEATYYKIQNYISADAFEFNLLIDKKIPIIIGLRTGRLFWSMKGDFKEQNYKSINIVDNRLSKGHAVTIIGYDNSVLGGSWIIANFLGPKWGFKGYGILPYECCRDIGEAYIVKPFYGIHQ